MRKMLTKNRNAEYFIFFLVAYGVNFLLGIPLIFHSYINIQVFAGLMVLLPATGVFLVKFLYKEEEDGSKMLRNIMFGLCLFYFLIIILEIAGIMSGKAAYLSSQTAITVGSILLLVFRRRGKDSEPIFNHIDLVKKSILLFVLLLVARNIMLSLSSSTMILDNIYTMLSAPFMLLFLFLLGVASYFGEEYGWRGYLQKKMQDKFGKRLGVVLLGILWEFWHMPLWFTVYDLEAWEIPLRFLLAISLAIFLGYIYMRTSNVWLCALLHCTYNILTVTASPKVQGELSVPQKIIPLLLIFVLSLFIFAKEYAADVIPTEKQ